MAGKAKKSIRKTTKNKSNKTASKYNEKFVINGSFQDLVKELVTPKTVAKSK